MKEKPIIIISLLVIILAYCIVGMNDRQIIPVGNINGSMIESHKFNFMTEVNKSYEDNHNRSSR